MINILKKIVINLKIFVDLQLHVLIFNVMIITMKITVWHKIVFGIKEKKNVKNKLIVH